MEKLEHRRRMRGAATFLIVVSLIGLVVSSAALITSDNFETTDKFLTLVLGAAGTLIGALMVWNGSIIGALFLVLWIASGLVQSVQPIAFAPPGSFLRTAAYLTLSIWMLRHLICYRQLSKQDDEHFGGSAIIRWGGKALAASLAALVGVGIWFLSTGISTAVVAGRDIPSDQIQWMLESKLLQANEKPLMFYSEGLTSIAEGGNLLTDKFVGSWGDMTGEDATDARVRLGEICETKMIEQGSYLNDAVYQLHSFAGDPVEIWLSIEDNVHKIFLARMKLINKRKMHPEVRKACEEDRSPNWQQVKKSNGIPVGIVSGDRITLHQKLWLKEHGFLTKDESIEKFFSYGRYSIAAGGTLLTDTYFGGWFTDNGIPDGWWAKVGHICSIEKIEEAREDALVRYQVTSDEDGWMKVRLPAGNLQTTELIEHVLAENAALQTKGSLEKCTGILSPEDTGAASRISGTTP